jgi:glycosyltransferase involved in cell wall biosynthesis
MQFVALMVAKNEEKFLVSSLNSIFKQTKSPDMLYFVDDFSDDKTGEIARKFDKLQYFHAKDFGFIKQNRQHGKRIHCLQNKALMRFLRNEWKYLMVIDADIVLPKDYCRQVINHIIKTGCVMVGPKYVETPTKVEVSTDTHIRGCAYIVTKSFINFCLRRGLHLGTQYGEVLWERLALANGYKVRALPIKVYQMRETGITSEGSFNDGRNLYRLGTPFPALLSLRGFSLKRFIGYVYALLHQETSLLSKTERRNLFRRYLNMKVKL